MFQLSTGWYWSCLQKQQHSVTVDIHRIGSLLFEMPVHSRFDGLISIRSLPLFFLNRQDVMTRRGKGGERNNNNKKISYESVTQKRKNIRKEKKRVFGQCLSNIVSPYWDSDGWLGGCWGGGGKRRKSWSAEELLASVTALGIFVLFSVLSHKNKKTEKNKASINQR